MAARVVARSELTDLEDGGNLHTVLTAVAREIDDVNFQMTNLQQIWDLDTATGEDLDDRALDYPPDGLTRQGANPATTEYVFSRTGTTGTIPIPQGSIVRVPSGGPEYQTTVAGAILDGFSDSGSIPIEALVPGSEGNVDANTITQFDAITGIETGTNPLPAIGGQDEETDAQLRTRIKEYVRSLPRGTPDALKFAVLDAFDVTQGRITSAELVELDGADLGKVLIYVDDGTGTIAQIEDNIGSPETVVSSALGGEERLFLDNKPLVLGTPVAVELNAAPLTEGVDFTVNFATGQITLVVALSPTDNVTAEYTWHTGLIAEAQKIVDGDPNDRENYPGYRAAGVQVFVIAPVVVQQIIEGVVVVADDFIGQTTAVLSDCASAISRYINNLPINGDVILSELIAAVMGVTGVVDVTFTTPTANVIIGEGELARVQGANIDLT